MTKTIALIDLWTDDNRGDAALQLSLVKLLRERFPDARLIGVYRFGWNEIGTVGREIALTSAELDEVLGGPRLTHLGGGEAFSWPGQAVAFQLGSMARFFAATAAFRLAPGVAERV